MKYIRAILLIIQALFFITPLFAQEDSVDLFVKTQMQKRKIPGLQLAVVRNGSMVKTGNYGFSNVQDSIPVSDRTVFPINSITKAFTGVAIMQLVEAGKLSLSSPVSAYLSDLPKAWNDVTVLQLLAHLSGIPDITDEAGIIGIDEEDAWKRVIALPVQLKPGERFVYNQTNYMLLGRIIDKLSGMSFRDFIIKEQLLKTGMTKTAASGFGASKQVIPNAAGGYRFERGTLNNMFFSLPPSLQTAAGMSSTVKEISQWIIALQNKQFLKEKASLDLLWTPARLNNGNIGGFSSLLNGYAVGWPIVARTEHPAAAAVGGARSALFVYPEDNLSIVVLTNLAGASPEEFIDEIAGFYIPDMKESNGFGLSVSIKSLRNRLERSGYNKAIDEVQSITKSNREFKMAENEVNGWGYKLMKQGRMREAMEIFKLNVYLYPQSANTYDSLGEIYAELGELALAIKNYEQSLKLDPQNRNAVEQLKRLRSTK